MRSTILTTSLLLLLFLVAGCGGGSDSSENIVENPPPAPMDGITGRVSSRMSGAALSVVDAESSEVVLASGRTTNSQGTYNLIFSEFAIEEGIMAPLIVSADGSGATAICDFDAEGDSDCLTADGSLAPFGSTYTLPNGYIFRGLSATFPPDTGDGADRSVTVNISAASDLATHYALTSAAGASLVAADVDTASQQALGVVEFITGLTTNGSALNDIAIIDLTNPGSPGTDSLALALFGASLNGSVDTDIPSLSTYHRVLSRITDNIQVDPNSESNYLTAPGNFLAQTINAYIATAEAHQASLPSPSPVLAGAIAAQKSAAKYAFLAGSNPISIALPADPASDEPLAQSKTFASRLSEVMGSTLITSSVDGFGGTAAGAASVYSEQLSVTTTLTSREVRQAFIQLDDAIAEAVANSETELTGTNVSGVLSVEGDTVTMSTATSTVSNIQTGISVNITIPTGTRVSPGATGVFDATEITISVSQTQDDLTTQQLFQGALVMNMVAVTSGADVSTMNYNGNIRASSGLNFTGNLGLASLAPFESGSTSPTGTYDSTFVFADGSTVSMQGKLETQISMYTVNSGASTIMADLEMNSVTDMTTTLNLTLDSSNRVTGGELVSQGVSTGTIDDDGIISYSDGTSQALPAPVI